MHSVTNLAAIEPRHPHRRTKAGSEAIGMNRAERVPARTALDRMHTAAADSYLTEGPERALSPLR